MVWGRRRLVLGSALAALGPRAARAAEGAAARVVRREGSSVLLRAGGGDDRPLEVGAELFRGDRVGTGPGARVELLFGGGLAVVVGPGTIVAVDDYAGGDGRGAAAVEVVLGLLVGIVRLVGPARAGGEAVPRRVEVRTRSALAAARSTEWLVDAAPEGRTGVLVLSGSVGVAGLAGGAEVTLGPGQGTDVAPGAAPTPPATWRAARRDAALARTTLGAP